MMSNASDTPSTSTSGNNEPIKRKKEIGISNDILHDIVSLIPRAELGQNFSLVSQRFHGLAYRKMHVANTHWVEGECQLIANAEKTTMVVPRGDGGGFELVPVPAVRMPENVLGFRGRIHFNGTLTDSALAFFRLVLPTETTLYRFSFLEEFYRANSLLTPFDTSENINTFLDNCVHQLELGGNVDAFIDAFLSRSPMRQRIRKLRATRFRELFINWLHQQRDDEWRQLQFMRCVSHDERNRMIKLIFQNLNNDVSSSPSSPSSSTAVLSNANKTPPAAEATAPSSSSASSTTASAANGVLRFCVRLTVSNWGDHVDRLPLRWLRNSRTGQCVLLVEQRRAQNTVVDMCIVRCPFADAHARGLTASDVTMADLQVMFGWDEPVCTVDVLNRHENTTEDGNNPMPPDAAANNAINATPLHQLF